MSFSRLLVPGVAILWLSGSSLDAQLWAGRGRLQGDVKDEQGQPVEGVKVTLRKGRGPVDVGAPGPEPTFTNERGKWSILGLAGGIWGVLLQKEGFVESEGHAAVHEYGSTPALERTLRRVPQEILAAAARNAARAAIERGNRLFQAGKHAESRTEYEASLPLLQEIDRPPILRSIARAYHEEGYGARAVATLETALAIAPSDVESLRLMVSLLVAQDQETAAREYMAKLPDDVALDPDALLSLGVKRYNEGRMDEAFADFDRAVRDNPNFAEAYYYRGLALLALRRIAEAKVDFRKVLDLDPEGTRAAECRELLKAL